MVNNKYKPVKALQRGLVLIDAISQRKEGAFLKDLAAQIGCSSAATYHLVNTLVEHGYVQRLESPVRYVLGDGLLQLLENQKRDLFYVVVQEVMKKLASELPGVVVYLSEYVGGSVVIRQYVDSTTAPDQIRDGRMRILPPYISAGSLVHLAFWPPDIQEEYENRYSFNTHGLQFWGSRGAYERALSALRKEKAFLLPESSPLRLRLGVPIFHSRGSLAAAFTVQWNQKDEKNLAQKKKKLIEVALRETALITERIAI